MGKYTQYKGCEDKYSLLGTEVVHLMRYLYQSFYSDDKGRRIDISVSKVYNTQDEAQEVSHKMIAESNEAKKAYEKHLATNHQNRVREGGHYSTRPMSYSERRYYED